MNNGSNESTPSHAGGAAVAERFAALISRLRVPGLARSPSASGETEPLDLWDPVGVPDPISIARGHTAARLAR